MLKKEMNMLKGGAIIRKDPTTPIYIGCGCAENTCPCEYAGPKEGPDDDKWGGSSISANGHANGGSPLNEVLTVGMVIV